MYGAVIGDIVGSRFEWDNRRDKTFTLFGRGCFYTDDTAMTVAVARAILECAPDRHDLGGLARRAMREIGRARPDRGYGSRFLRWLQEDGTESYGSFGNGSAMRVSACGWAAKTLDEAKTLSKLVTEVTHDHPEGIKGAEAVACAIFLARTGAGMKDIRRCVSSYYEIDFTLDEIRPTYTYSVTCQGSVPQALEAFLESTDFEDAVRNAISIGGDSDTIAAITGSVAEAYYGIPRAMREEAGSYLAEELIGIIEVYEALSPPKVL